MRELLRGLLAPDVTRHLLVSEREVIIDEVHRHPITKVWPVTILVGAVLLFGWMPFWGALFWVPLLAGLYLAGLAILKLHSEFMDRFVVTNMRVFRVHGIFSQHLATVPIARILDISLHRPFLGQMFNYGHFVFESAAQDQGLREIRFVGDPEKRDLTIQRVIQRSGIRAAMDPDDEITAPL